MTRRPDWEARLGAAVTEALGKPFRWGVHDCCTFAADCVHAVTGADPMADLRGRYRHRRDAARLLRSDGGLEAMVTCALGPPSPDTLHAHRGDVVLIDGEQGAMLGVVAGASAWVPMRVGLQRVARGDWRLVWRVI